MMKMKQMFPEFETIMKKSKTAFSNILFQRFLSEIRESPLDGGLHGSTTLDLDENDVALPTEGSRTILFPNDPDVRGSSANADLLDNETGHLNAARHVANMNTITVESDVDDEEDEEDEDSEEHQVKKELLWKKSLTSAFH